ncbi:nuclear pore complex protein NUP85 [Phalaenopsis equestris]|uniref:nuclear pore complex protein NUP85 n=1 Tax=Phalaenopsis equestris TaxID=78828 RepID=UPI0009E282FA|nr:nuclear pore complex protein NUP85 [Phalaenopsis equestris]XP_020575377.1 nuclear pore complex protein NUP85 [Phalaenopsis equestris]
MPGRPSEPDNAVIPLPAEVEIPIYHIRHGVKPPIIRVFASWSRGNVLQVACIRSLEDDIPDGEGNGISGDVDLGGKVVEVKLGTGDPTISESPGRRIIYDSVTPFALLQSRRNTFLTMSRMPFSFSHPSAVWWQQVLEYSRSISELFGTSNNTSQSVIDDPMMILEQVEKPSSLKAAWELMEIFYADKHSFSWFPERLVDWLAEYDAILSETQMTVHLKLAKLQEKLVNLQVIEDDPEYWEVLSSVLSIGWLDVAAKLLRLHGSYQLNQIDNRETENGLVETVAVLISTMPRLRHDLPMGKLGQCYKTKPDFIKAWEKWRDQITKLDCSAFWVQCSHRPTREGLRNLLQIMLGNFNSISKACFHWMELFISHFLFIRPLTVGFEEMLGSALKFMRLKSSNVSNGLMRLLLGILGENTEVVMAECFKSFGPWMVTHSAELLTADSHQNELLLYEERYSLGGISIMELHRLIYAQVLASHSVTWQIAPSYLLSCPKQGLGLLENLLFKQSVQNYQTVLKNLEICQLNELYGISSSIKKIAGMHHWKHGRKGFGVYWLQEARDEGRLNRIAQQLFDCIGKSISDETFKQWEGLIELLGPDVGTAGGVGFLHRYRDFKKSLRQAKIGRLVGAAKHTIDSLLQLMKSPSTPQRFWLPLLHDAVELLNWKDQPLLNVFETNFLLKKLQELSMAQLRPDFSQADLPPEALTQIRLALATNLSRAFLEE